MWMHTRKTHVHTKIWPQTVTILKTSFIHRDLRLWKAHGSICALQREAASLMNYYVHKHEENQDKTFTEKHISKNVLAYKDVHKSSITHVTSTQMPFVDCFCLVSRSARCGLSLTRSSLSLPFVFMSVHTSNMTFSASVSKHVSVHTHVRSSSLHCAPAPVI